MMNQAIQLKGMFAAIRRSFLFALNRKQMTTIAADPPAGAVCPAFVIASPTDLHLAPRFSHTLRTTLPTCILANGCDDDALDWLQANCGTDRVVPLRASLRKNRATYLAHADVIHLACETRRGDIIICDADCYVNDSEWIRNVPAVGAGEYAVGPFGKQSTLPGIRIPDTFFLRINTEQYFQIAESCNSDATIRMHLPAGLQKKIKDTTGQQIDFIEPGKKYLDTLQTFWGACIAQELKFHEVPGDGSRAFHVGGSSYLLTDRDFDMLHWDCWAANTIFFHLRFAELENDPFITGRLAALFRRHTGSDAIVKKIPQLTESWRYSQSIRILKELFTD